MKKLIVPVLLAGIIGWMGYREWTRPKTGYISIREVFDGFAMKKELQQDFEKTKAVRQRALDTMEMKLRVRAAQLQNMKPGENREMETEFAVLREDFFTKKKTFEEDNIAMAEQADKQIMGQINQYIRDFGAENGYKFIFGAGDDGNVMYANEADNISKQVIEYINKKYSGKK